MLTIWNGVLVTVALFNAGLAFFIWRTYWRNPINLFFGIFLSAIALWSFALIGFQSAHSALVSVYFGKVAYASSLLIGVSFYLFSIVFPDGKRPTNRTLIAVCGMVGVFLFALLGPTQLFETLIARLWPDPTISLPFKEYFAFMALFSFFFIGGLAQIWHKYLHTKRPTRQQLLVLAISVTIAGLAGVYYNLVLASPFFADYRYLWTGPLSTTFIAVMVMYAIFRLHLFKTKVLTAELLIALLCGFTFLRTLLAVNAQERLLNAALFVLSLAIGSVLVRSVYKEVRTRERIERQERDLEASNVRLRELDMQKSEFLSFASHQLRTPLTAIKWNSGAILEGSFGDVPAHLREPIQSIFDQSSLMAVLVDDYLNVSRIEQGRMRYQFASVDLAALIKGVAAEFEPALIGKGLTLSTDLGEGPVMVWGDAGKLTQVFSNIIDNAIKYTPQGHISIVLSKISERGVAHVEIRDTGIGMDDATLHKVFEKFTRGDNATELNSAGSGLGLFIVRTFIESHKGKVWPESGGINKGTSFYIELPLSLQK